MDDTQTKIIWFIDNEQDDLEICSRQISDGIQKFANKDVNISVDTLVARPHKDDYLEVLNNPQTGAILIDQQLKTRGGVDHTGIELAQYLREYDDILPIYILTNHKEEEDFLGGQWIVEDIISKSSLRKDEELPIIIKRMVRQIGQHQKITDERTIRFRQLILKSIDGTISEQEHVELENLQFWRSAPLIAHEYKESTPSETEKILEQLRELRKGIEQLKNEG